jgi:hypothetical protein
MHLLPGLHKDGPQPHFKRRDWQICDSNLPEWKEQVVLAEMEPGRSAWFWAVDSAVSLREYWRSDGVSHECSAG